MIERFKAAADLVQPPFVEALRDIVARMGALTVVILGIGTAAPPDRLLGPFVGLVLVVIVGVVVVMPLRVRPRRRLGRFFVLGGSPGNDRVQPLADRHAGAA